MKTSKSAACVAAVILVGGLGCAALSANSPRGQSTAGAGPYKLSKTIQVGGEGGWDYLSVDPAAGRLYVSHAMKVVVVDLA